jgi:glycosyltransferase involved in cell wall biosynthesis
MPEPGLVTTIIPVYNRAAMLVEAVASVIAQKYRPIEILIVDDGSTDDTPHMAEWLAREHDGIVRVLRQENAGPGAARERGRLEARGEFVQHLDSDDLLLAGKFDRQVAGLREHPECGASYGWTRWQLADGSCEREPAKRSGEQIETMFPAMLQSRWWDTPSPLYRRSVIDAAGAWLPLRIEEDWEYDARIASQGVRLHFVDDWVAQVRRHEEGHLSGRGDAATLRDRAAAHEQILRHAQAWSDAGGRTGGTGEAAIRDDASLPRDFPEMRHFARELFLLARQCGAAGLTPESRRLFELAREASGPDASRLQFRAYSAVANVLGWSAAGKIATLADRWRW